MKMVVFNEFLGIISVGTIEKEETWLSRFISINNHNNNQKQSDKPNQYKNSSKFLNGERG